MLGVSHVRRGIVILRLRSAASGALAVRLTASGHDLSHVRRDASNGQLLRVRLPLSSWARRRLRGGSLHAIATIAARGRTSSR